MSEAKERLARLLGIVPFVMENQGVRVEVIAHHFGVDVQTINDDLRLLFVTGRPGHMPDDLVDAQFEDGSVYISNADEVALPVRLSPAEAATLIMALHYLEAANPDRAEAVAQLRTKLQTASGSTTEPIVELPAVPHELRCAVSEARTKHLPLLIEYYVASRDELSQRIVNPHGLRLDGRWYLDAHCSAGERSFVVDNIESVRVCQAGTSEPPRAHERPLATDYRMVFDAEAAWLLDEYDFRDLDFDDAQRTAAGTITVFSQAWLDRLLLSHGRHLQAIHPTPDFTATLHHLRSITADSLPGE